MVRNLAFMRVTLDELQEIIIRDGVVERYQNGANQYGVKQSAALQSYNSLIKNYAAVAKTLVSFLPPPERKQFQAAMIREKTAEELEAERREREESAAYWAAEARKLLHKE